MSDILHKDQFGADFIWGAATAAFQTEGAHDSDGKGLSIWDVFTAKRGKIKRGHHAEMSCDFYNSFNSDIALMLQMQIPNFRFSLSWPRIMPNGRKPVNAAGIDYYDRLIDNLLKAGIEPWVTLYHWDLPHALELQGGWTNRDIVSWFSDYVEECAARFGDRVKNWMVMNEPSVFTGAGYFLGIHAPGRRGLTNYLQAVHHATLATAAGGRILKSMVPDGNIGTTYSFTHIEPYSSSARDVAAAHRVDTLLNRTFLEPLLGLGYPIQDLPLLAKIDKYILEDDLQKMAFDFDFIGVQCYTREIVKASYITPYIGASIVSATRRKVPTTEMKWEVYPPSIYHLLHKINAYTNIPEMIITENGAAFPDEIINGRIYDTKRIQYLQDHLLQVRKAQREGCRVGGYFVWSLMDNFEWAEGYHPRFGLVHVNFDTQERIIKQSGIWYRNLISNSL